MCKSNGQAWLIIRSFWTFSLCGKDAKENIFWLQVVSKENNVIFNMLVSDKYEIKLYPNQNSNFYVQYLDRANFPLQYIRSQITAAGC